MNDDSAAEDAAYVRAVGLAELGKPEALRDFVTAQLAIDPSDSRLWCLLSLAQLSLGQGNLALAAADRAIAFDPANAWGFRARCGALVAIRQFSVGAEAARCAIELEPLGWQGFTSLAMAQLGGGEASAALIPASRAVELAPTRADPLYVRGWAESETGQMAAAVGSFEQALAIDPNHAGALSALGVMRLRKGKTARGTRHLLSSINSDPLDPITVQNLEAVPEAVLIQCTLTLFVAAVSLTLLVAVLPQAQWVRPIALIATLTYLVLVVRRTSLLLPRGFVVRSWVTSPKSGLKIGSVSLLVYVVLLGCLPRGWAVSGTWIARLLLLSLVPGLIRWRLTARKATRG